ncbi:MAG: alpha/beta hydrolase [Halioglobus sp.]
MLTQALNWLVAHESVLSGVAAVAGILGVLFAFSVRSYRYVNSRAHSGSSSPDDVAKRKTSVTGPQVRYCQTSDGHRIAWASNGAGFPLVRSLGWFSNLDVEANSPVASAFWNSLAQNQTLLRYDGRGIGLSDRDTTEFSSDTRLEDLESVIDASGVDKFALMGLSEGGPTAIRYAAKHPDRVACLILWGSFLNAPTPSDVPQFVSLAQQTRDYWGKDSGAFHQMFTALFLPEGNSEQNKLFNEMQRASSSAATAERFFLSIADADVRSLAPGLQVPTLVLHRRGDLVVPYKYGQEIAAQLPNAELVLLDGSNHWMICEEDDTDYVVGLIEDFIARHNPEK